MRAISTRNLNSPTACFIKTDHRRTLLEKLCTYQKKRRKLSQVKKKKVKTRHQKVPCFKRHFVADNLSREYKYYCTDEMSTFQSILQSLNLKNNFGNFLFAMPFHNFHFFSFFSFTVLLFLAKASSIQTKGCNKVEY